MKTERFVSRVACVGLKLAAGSCWQMLTADVEKEFLRTLSLIHSKDPRIYDKQTQFFRKDGTYFIAPKITSTLLT